MDKQRPPRPLTTRATREAQRLALPARPERKNTNPIGGALGSLAIGAWSFAFLYWFHLSGVAFWIVGGFGFLWIALGLFLVGLSVTDFVDWRHPHG